ncbi:MAG: hypothetical protein AUJ88_06385 [Gallionellaceae bacterium CG1_02_56_997]|nr:MAG: hypothetical protein AUJ88_06385 [Gallionellaceae bacterium CG1_02_56_997]
MTYNRDNVKHAQRRIVPLALWERGDGGEGTGMACFIIRGGNMPCPLDTPTRTRHPAKLKTARIIQAFPQSPFYKLRKR